MSKQGINIILYPRTYNKRGGESLHSVIGVTDEGKEVNIKLRLDEEHTGKDNMPSIAEFSRTDAKAKQSCIATETNSPENREGVLLFSKAQLQGVNDKGIETYIAKWASVLCNHSESPSPITGVGRMEIKRDTPIIRALKNKLKEAELSENEEGIRRVNEELNNAKNFSFPLIMYHYKSMIKCIASDIDSFKIKAVDAISKSSITGSIPGFMIRNLDKNGKIVPGSVFEHYALYNADEERYQNAIEIIDYFIDKYSDSSPYLHFDNGSETIELIPLSKIVTGKMGNKYYGQGSRYEHIKNMYYSNISEGNEDLSSPMLCKIAARVTVYEEDRMLLSRAHSISHQLGTPDRIDEFGRFTKSYSGEESKLSQASLSKENLKEKRIGLSASRLPSRAIWIIKGESAPKPEAPDVDKVDIPVSETVQTAFEGKRTSNQEQDHTILKASESQSGDVNEERSTESKPLDEPSQISDTQLESKTDSKGEINPDLKHDLENKQKEVDSTENPDEDALFLDTQVDEEEEVGTKELQIISDNEKESDSNIKSEDLLENTSADSSLQNNTHSIEEKDECPKDTQEISSESRFDVDDNFSQEEGKRDSDLSESLESKNKDPIDNNDSEGNKSEDSKKEFTGLAAFLNKKK